MDPGSTNCLQQKVTNKLQTDISHNSETQELSEIDPGRSLRSNESQLKNPDSDQLNMSNLSLDNMEVKLEDNPPDMFEKLADDLETTQMKCKYDHMIEFYHDELFVSSNQYGFERIFNQECESNKEFNYLPMLKDMFFDAIKNPNNFKEGERQNKHKRNILQKKSKYSVSELNSRIYKQQQEKSRLELNETVDSKQFETELNCKITTQDANTTESQPDSQVELCRLEPEIFNSAQLDSNVPDSLSCIQPEINDVRHHIPNSEHPITSRLLEPDSLTNKQPEIKEIKQHTLNHLPTIKSEVNPDKITCTQEQTHCTSPPQLRSKLNLGERKAAKVSEPTTPSKVRSMFNADKTNKSEPSDPTSPPQLGIMVTPDKRKEDQLSDPTSPPQLRSMVTPDKRKEAQLSEPTSPPQLRSMVTPDKRKEAQLSEPTSLPQLRSMVTPDKRKEAQLSEPTSPPQLRSMVTPDKRKEAQLSEPTSPPQLRSMVTPDRRKEAQLSEPTSPPQLGSKLNVDKRKEAKWSKQTTRSKVRSMLNVDKRNKSEPSEPTCPPKLGSMLDYDRRKAQLSEPVSPTLNLDKRKEAKLSEPTTPLKVRSMLSSDKRNKSEPTKPTSPPQLGSMLYQDKRKEAQISEPSSPLKCISKLTPDKRKEAQLSEPTSPPKLVSKLNLDKRKEGKVSEPTTPSKVNHRNKSDSSEPISPPKLKSKLMPDKRKEAKLSEPTSLPKFESNCTKQDIHEFRPAETVCHELKIDNTKIKTKKSQQTAITEFVPGAQIHRENNEIELKRNKSGTSITQTDRQHCTEQMKIIEIEPTKTKYVQREQTVGLQQGKTNDAQREETIEMESKRKKSATNNVQIDIRKYTEQLKTSKIESISPNYSEQDPSTGRSHPEKNVAKRETTSSLQLKTSNPAQQDATSTSQPETTNLAQASKMNDSRTNILSHPQQTKTNKHEPNRPNDSQHCKVIKVKLTTGLYKKMCEDMANEKGKETSVANDKTSKYDHKKNVEQKIEGSEQKKFEDFSSVKETFMLALGLDFQDKNESINSLNQQGQEISYACGYCESVFDDKDPLIFHLASHKFIRNTRNPVLKPLVKEILERSQNTSRSNVGDDENRNANVKLLNDSKASETINESEQVKEENNMKTLNGMHSSIHENVDHKRHKERDITALGNCPIEDSSSERAKSILKNVSDFNSKDLCRHNDKKKQESRTEKIVEATSSYVRKRKTLQSIKDKTINLTAENNLLENHREIAASSDMNDKIFKAHQDAYAQQEEKRDFELETNDKEQIQTTAFQPAMYRSSPQEKTIALTNQETNHVEKHNCAQPNPLSQFQLEVTNLAQVQTTELQHEIASDAQQGKTSELEPELNNSVHQEQARKLEHKITYYVQQKPTVELQEEIHKSVKQDPTSEMLTETTKYVKRRKIKQLQSKLTDYSQATSKLQQIKATYRRALTKKVLKSLSIFNRPIKKSKCNLGKRNCTQPNNPITAGTHSQKLKKLQLQTKKSIQPVVNKFEEETKIDLETIEMESKRKKSATNNVQIDMQKYTGQKKTSKIKPTSPNHSQQDPSTGKSHPEKNITKREKTSSLQLNTSNPGQQDATSTQPETTNYAQALKMNVSRTNRLSHAQQTITNKHEPNYSKHSNVIKVKLAPILYKKLCEDLENEKDKETSNANVTTGNRSKYDHEQNVEKQIEGSEQKKNIEDFSAVKETFILALGLDFQDKNESINSLNQQGQEISYACGYCENVFDQKDPLIFHLASHKFIRNTRNPVLKPLVKEILERSQNASSSNVGDDENHNANVKLLNDSKAFATINESEQGKEDNDIKTLNGVYSSIRENVDHRQHKESEITALENCPTGNSPSKRVKNTLIQKEQESRREDIVEATSSNGRKRKISQSKKDRTINITTENNVLENYREHAACPDINDENSKIFQDKGSPNSVSVGDEINTLITSSKLRLPKKNKRKREKNVNTEDTCNRYHKEKLPRTEEIFDEKGTDMVGINSTQSGTVKNLNKSTTDKSKYLKNLKKESKKQSNNTSKNSTEMISAIEASFSSLHLGDTSKEKNSQFRHILAQNFRSSSFEISNDKNHIAKDSKASENNQLENYTEPAVKSSINNDNSKILEVSPNRVLGKEMKSAIHSSKLSLPNKNKRKRRSKVNLINVPELNTEDLCKPNYEEKQLSTEEVLEKKVTNVVRINRTESRRIITARRSVTAKIKQSNNCTIGAVSNNAIEGNSGDNLRIIEDKGSPDRSLETNQINSIIGSIKRKLSKPKKRKLDNTALLDVCPKSIKDIRKVNNNEPQPQTGEELGTNEVGISKKQPKRNITKTGSVSTEKDCTKSNLAPPSVNIVVRTEEDTFICNNCGRILKSKDMLISHLKTHSDKSSLTAKNKRDLKFKCKTCKSKFVTQSELLNHEVKAHDCDKSYRACTICEYKTPYPYRLKTHMRAHNNIKPFECTFCKKEFRTTNDLKLHVRTHTGETPYQCEFCLLKFPRRPTLNRHLKTHSGERPYKCVYCAADFKLVSALKHHLSTHADERPFKCSNCNSSFRDTSALEEHMRSHKGETPYKCYRCEYSSASRHGLQRHAKTHEIEASDVAKKKSLLAERPHKCTVCTANFTLLSHLKRHLNIHFKEKCYKCTTCSSSFSDGSSLKRHMRCHTGEKSYRCSQCEYTTANNFDLTRHAKLHLKTNKKNKNSNVLTALLASVFVRR